MRFEFTDPAPAEGNADPRGVQWEIRAVRSVLPAGAGSLSSASRGAAPLGTFALILGFYLTDYSSPPYLPLF